MGVNYEQISNLRAALKSYSDRREVQSRRFDLLNDRVQTHIETALGEKFGEAENYSDLLKFLDLSNNSYKYIIRLLSQVYKEPATRTFSDPEDTDLWHLIVPSDIDVDLEAINRITMACNECLVRPVIRDSQLELDIIPPHCCEVASYGKRLNAIIYKLENGGFCYIDREIEAILNSDGKIEIAFKNKLGHVPIVTFRRTRPINSYWVGADGEDLVNGYIDQTILRTYLNRTLYYQSFIQVTKEEMVDGTGDIGMGEPEQGLGPHKILKGKFNTLSLQTELQSNYAVCEQKLSRLAANWGISAEALNQSRYTSGIERLLSNASLLEHRKSTIKLFRPRDMELMVLVTKLWNLQSSAPRFSDSPVPKVDFAELSLTESTRDQLEALKVQMETGTGSAVDYVMRTNPDIKSREEALKVVRRNLAETAEVLTVRSQFLAVTGGDQGELGGRPLGKELPLITQETVRPAQLEPKESNSALEYHPSMKKVINDHLEKSNRGKVLKPPQISFGKVNDDV